MREAATETKEDDVPGWVRWLSRFSPSRLDRYFLNGEGLGVVIPNDETLESLPKEERRTLLEDFKKQYKKQYYSRWFNRLNAVLSWARFFFQGAIIFYIWFSLTNADWYYRLLIAGFVSALVRQILQLLLSPMGILFWMIDHRYPIKTRFQKAFLGFVSFILTSAVNLGIIWLLITHQIGNPGDYLSGLR